MQYNQTPLTSSQKKDWQYACASFMAQAPGFRYLWNKMLCHNHSEHYAIFTKDIPTAATDGFNILINPDFFFGSDEYDKIAASRGGVKSLRHRPQRVFVLFHEVAHNVYNDVNFLHKFAKSKRVPMRGGGHLPFENDVFQRAADYRINALGVQSKIGKIPDDCKCYDEKIATAQDSFLDTYKKLYKKKKEDGKMPSGGFDEVLPPGNSTGQSPDQAAEARSDQQWAVEISIAHQQERLKGNMPEALRKMFQDILQPEVYWLDHIRGIFNRKVGSGSYDWRKPDRRFIVRDIYVPGRSGHGAKHVVFWGDSSGSMVNDVEKALAEMAGIMEDVRPERMTLLWCDAKIQAVEELRDAADLEEIRRKGAPGLGGSDSNPVFRWIAENCYEEPDALVCFTDAFISFPDKAPTYPVIWCVLTDQPVPFGDLVRVKYNKTEEE